MQMEMIMSSNLEAEDVLTASMDQYIIKTQCPFIDEFEVLFQNKGADNSKGTFTINSYQFDATKRIKKDFNHVTEWIEGKCRANKIPIKNLKIDMSWCIDYSEGGYQGLHSHGTDLISVVFHLDDQPEGEGFDGMFYSIMPRPVGTQWIQNHIPKRGQCLILDGKVFHGVYPVKKPRRSVVIDFDYDWLEAEEIDDGSSKNDKENGDKNE